MRSISPAQRRARLGLRHRLVPSARAADVVSVARDLVCLHATDPSTVYLSTWARMDGFEVADLDRALYEGRTLLRMLAMRRTVFVAPVEDAPILHAAASLAVASRERRRNEQLATMLGTTDVAGWLRTAERETIEALERLGEATATDLAREVPMLREKVRVNVGKPYEADLGMSSRVLLVMAAEGRIVRARPRGSWLSSQYRWASLAAWLGQPLADIPVADAQAELIGRWLARFGPGTERDIRWWTGLTAREVRGALARIGAVDVDLGGEVGLVLPGDLEDTTVPDPWVALLPSLDPTTMGWQARDWYLGPHKARLFDTSGNAGPTIWADGRVVGGWAVRPDGVVLTRLLEDVGREHEAAIEAEAGRLSAWLQATRVIPRFPTPMQRELVG